MLSGDRRGRGAKRRGRLHETMRAFSMVPRDDGTWQRTRRWNAVP